MKLSPETRDIIRQYKTVVNERRQSAGLSPLKTERIIEEICYSMTYQCSVYIGGAFIIQGGRDVAGK
ncbi:hypothetical protein [Serratia liquefaciens]|uniref:hypothetical protein n=1 Tax=Serratia liquefaciens TaxID=614 RepID=UPI001F4C249D|nr:MULTISPECIES: hypothetical protein [Serratia]ULG12813.1 AreA [Serratia liquefaciens]ULG12921.1 AreA [Serratia liquefaciens]ULG13403.1 AreA [Serratia proteamaculans]ULG18850.1 AreA [Serratia proteamaculans]CAI2535367.1 Uncharacterised protein [Serratia liquefaciens]